MPIFLAISVFGLMIAIFGFVLKGRQEDEVLDEQVKRSLQTQTTTGKVIAMAEGKPAETFDTTPYQRAVAGVDCTRRVEYVVDGRRYQVMGQYGSSEMRFAIGSEIAVSYNPSSPENGTVQEEIPVLLKASTASGWMIIILGGTMVI